MFICHSDQASRLDCSDKSLHTWMVIHVDTTFVISTGSVHLVQRTTFIFLCLTAVAGGVGASLYIIQYTICLKVEKSVDCYKLFATFRNEKKSSFIMTSKVTIQSFTTQTQIIVCTHSMRNLHSHWLFMRWQIHVLIAVKCLYWVCSCSQVDKIKKTAVALAM